MHPFAEDPRESVATLGESRLICQTDPVVFGRHFDESLAPEWVGAKLLLRNLSDIAAMGGQPVAAVVSLSLPPNTSVRWLRGFYRGLARCSLQHATPIVGGDVSRSESCLAAHLTLAGRAMGGRAMTRSGARPKDVLVVTGPLGGSLLGRHARIRPRLAEGAWLAAREAVHACMDISDGLAKDLPALVPDGCVALIDSAMIPIHPAARRLATRTGRTALEHAICDGEDYELLAAISGETDAIRRLSDAFHRAFDSQLHVIGVLHKPVAGTKSPPVRSLEGDLDWSRLAGYEHFRETPGRD
jgi:thiamine-monophosphate kinase